MLWAGEGNPRLSAQAAEAIADPANEKLVSAVSAYGICLKHALGKLPGAAALASALEEEEIAALDCTPLSVTLAHAEAAGRLDMRHKDPFDPLLIAQARLDGLVARLQRGGVRCVRRGAAVVRGSEGCGDGFGGGGASEAGPRRRLTPIIGR